MLPKGRQNDWCLEVPWTLPRPLSVLRRPFTRFRHNSLIAATILICTLSPELGYCDMFETIGLPKPCALSKNKSQSGRQAFQRLLSKLLRTHRDQHEASHDARVVESGPDQIDVAECAYARFGYIPLLMTLVAGRSRPVVWLPSPRLPDNGGLQDEIHCVY